MDIRHIVGDSMRNKMRTVERVERNGILKLIRESKTGESMLLFNNPARKLIPAIRRRSAKEDRPKIVAAGV